MRSLLWVALVAAAATTGARGARHASRVDSVGALAAWQGEAREGEISQTYLLVTVEDEPAATGAACLDGTPPAYLFAPSKGGLNATSWVIWYKGGGWCYTLEDCVARSKGGDGSSAFDAPKEDDPSGGAFMSADPFVNPDFYDWNHVFAWYCDGGSWSGDREAPVTAATGEKLYFRGARNTAALIRSLSSHGRGLGDATRVLLSGGSAGGLTTILKADEWAKALPTAQVKAMPNAGFFLPHATARGTGTSYLDEMRVAWDTHNLTAGVPGTCLEAMEAQGRPAWECAFAPIAIEYVEAPVLLLQGAYDQWQANEILRIGCSYAPTAKTSQRVCGANDTARLTAYAMEVAGGAGSSTKLNEPGSGAWMHSCYFHDLMRESANWVAVHSSGVAARDAVRRWFFEGVGGVTMPCFWTPGAEGVNCEPTCPAPLDQTTSGAR